MRARHSGWPAAVLLGEVLLFFRHVLFYGHYVIPWDLRYYHLPLATFTAKELARGELPLWDPYTYCGMPVYANLTMQLFYPPTLLAVLVSNWTGSRHLLYFLECQIVGHVWLAGVLAYALLRRLGLSRASALTGATVYQLGAFFASQTQHLGAIDGAAWLPLAWLAVVALGERFRWRWLAALSFALAMSFLAGFPAVTAAVFGSTLLLATMLVLARRSSPALLGYGLAASLWGALISAVQLFPTIELTRLSVAALRSDWMGTGGGLPLAALISLVAPDHYGQFHFQGATWRLPWNVTFLHLYCGIPALILAALALVRRKNQYAAPFALLMVVSVFWMLGDSTPVGRTLFPLLPAAVRSAIYPEFASAVFTLTLAVLAGVGAQTLLQGRRPALALGLVALVAADLILVGSARPMNTQDEREEPGVSYSQISGSTVIPAGMRAMVRRTLPPGRVDLIGGQLYWANGAPLFEIPTANGNDPFALVRLMEVRLAFCKGERWGRFYQVSNPDSPVLDLLNVRYLISDAALKHPGRLKHVAALPGSQVYENPGALPRFFLVSRVRALPDFRVALAALRSPDFRPQDEALVEGFPNISSAAGPAGRVRVLSYAARELALETDSPGPAFLVTSETWYPGWRVWLDGGEVRPALTNVAFRGLPVPAGRHTVRMRFEPRILGRSAGVTLAAFALLVLAGWIGDNRPSRTPWSS